MVEIPGLNWRSYEISSRACSFLGRFYLEIEKKGLKKIPEIAILLAIIAPKRISEDHLSKSEQQRLVHYLLTAIYCFHPSPRPYGLFVSEAADHFPVVLNVCRRAAISFASLGDARPAVISLILPLAS